MGSGSRLLHSRKRRSISDGCLSCHALARGPAGRCMDSSGRCRGLSSPIASVLVEHAGQRRRRILDGKNASRLGISATARGSNAGRRGLVGPSQRRRPPFVGRRNDAGTGQPLDPVPCCSAKRRCDCLPPRLDSSLDRKAVALCRLEDDRPGMHAWNLGRQHLSRARIGAEVGGHRRALEQHRRIPCPPTSST